MEKIMKYKFALLSFLFFFIPIVLNASAQEKWISINFTNTPLGTVLDEISRQTSLSVVYNTKDVDPDKVVSIKASQENLTSVMGRLLKNTNASFSIKDKYLVLFTRETVIPNISQPQNKRIIRGRVTDEQGEPLIGVSVVIKGTATGTITDMNGEYSLEISVDNSVLELSYIGYQKVTLSTAGRTSFDMVMKEDALVLNEVVITAMGIERKAESLTYATQKVAGKELTRAKDVNFINSLQGKSAGLLITPNSSGAGGGSSKIILRGQSSMLGNNQPLIVLDGIPLANGMSGQTDDLLTGTSRDGGDLLSTINPDDVASMSILKGPNAAALYGSAANNGVIIITTKGGKEGKVKIDFSSNTTFETPLMYPKQQNDFAPEIVGNTIEYNAWGEKISELTDDQLATFPYLTRNPRNNVTDFFNLGQTYNNSIALSGGTEHSSTYFSYANTVQKGLIERNKFTRHSLLLKESYSLFNKRLKIDLSLNYITQCTTNRPVIGKAKGVLPGLYRTPSAVDLRYFNKNRTIIATADDKITQTIKNEQGQVSQQGNSHLIGKPIQNFPWLNQSWINNPYFMLDAMDDEAFKDRIMASFTAKYNIIDGLTAQARISLDKTNSEGTVIDYATIRRDKDQTLAARYWNSRSRYQEIYGDFLLTYNKHIENISLSATVGGSLKRTKGRDWSLSKDNDSTYVEPNIPYPNDSWNGSLNPDDKGRVGGSDSYGSKNWETAIFATAQIGFWEKGYIDVSIRNDWCKAFQQFAKGNEHISFPYYSIGGNLLLKELLSFNTSQVNNLKLRASYSVVGNAIPNTVYSMRTKNPLSGAWSASGVEFYSPKPETTKAFEVGLDGAFFDYKLDFDLTFYQSIMENQFLKVTSGTVSMPANTGKVRNRGVEFSANYQTQFSKDFRWTTGLNLAYNDNVILETYQNKETGAMEELLVGPASLGIVSKYLVGGAYGDLYGKDFKYDKSGKIMLAANGAPIFESDYTRYLGNTTAKFNFGWHNTFNYKDFSFYVLLDGKIGGKVLSLTEAELDQYGLSQRSADARNTNGGKVFLPDGQEIDARAYYESIGAEQFDCFYDATNLRVREISLGYTFFDLFGISRNLSVSLVARNLGFIYKNSPVDPDMSASAANAVSGIEAFSLPTTRSFGFNIKISF